MGNRRIDLSIPIKCFTALKICQIHLILKLVHVWPRKMQCWLEVYRKWPHSCADLTAVLLACGFRGGSADAQRSVLCLDTFLNSSFTALISLNVPNLKQGLVSCLSALHVPPRSLVFHLTLILWKYLLWGQIFQVFLYIYVWMDFVFLFYVSNNSQS